MTTQVVIKVETTGLNFSSTTPEDNDRITEIAAIKIIDGEIRETFHSYVNPEHELSTIAHNLTNLTRRSLDNEPRFSEIYQDLLAFISDSSLVFDFTNFTLNALHSELSRIADNTVDIKSMPRTSTLSQAKAYDKEITGSALKGKGAYTLESLTKRFHIKPPRVIDASREALQDAMRVAHLHLKLTDLLSRDNQEVQAEKQEESKASEPAAKKRRTTAPSQSSMEFFQPAVVQEEENATYTPAKTPITEPSTHRYNLRSGAR